MAAVRPDDPREKFAVSVWRDDGSEEDQSSFTRLDEAQDQFSKLEDGRKFKYGAIYEWHQTNLEWVCLDAWPESFDGF